MTECVVRVSKTSRKNLLQIIFVLAVFGVTQICAQNSHLGIYGGFASASMSGNYIEGSDGREWGFNFFLSLDREISQRWSIETGISWIQKGGQKLQLAGVPDRTVGFQTSYLQLPVLARYKFPVSNGPWHIVPFAGIALGANVGCAHKDGNRFEFEEDPCDENSPGGKPKELELSIPFGSYFWIEYKGGSRFILGLKYDLGLTNVFTAAEETGLQARNGALVFMFGFVGPLQ